MDGFGKASDILTAHLYKSKRSWNAWMKWYWKSKKAGFGKTKCLTNPRKSEESSPIPWVELGTQQKSLLPNVSGQSDFIQPQNCCQNKISFHKFHHFVWQIGGHVSQPHLARWPGGNPKHESDPKANQLFSCEVNGISTPSKCWINQMSWYFGCGTGEKQKNGMGGSSQNNENPWYGNKDLKYVHFMNGFFHTLGVGKGIVPKKLMFSVIPQSQTWKEATKEWQNKITLCSTSFSKNQNWERDPNHHEIL